MTPQTLNKDSKDYFTGKMFRRQYWPALISAFGLSFADMTDALVVGQRMGVTGLAAISLSLPLFMVMNTLMHGMGVGGSIRYSTQMAQGEREKAVSGFQGVIIISIIAGVILAALGNIFMTPLLAVLGTRPSDGELFAVCESYVRIIVTGIPLFFLSYIINYYLRNDDQERLATLGFTVGNLADLGLNFILVLGLDLGAAGAAWATISGHVLALMFYAVGIFGKSGNLSFKKLKPMFQGAAKCLWSGMSSSVQYLFNMAFLLLANNVLMHSAGSAGVAIFELVQNTSFLILYLNGAASQAAQPLLSTFTGEYNTSGRRSTLRYALIYGFISGTAAVVFVALFPDLICWLFGVTDPSVMTLGRYALRVYCIGAMFSGVNTIMESCNQACGREKDAFIIATLRGAALLLPLTAVLSIPGGNWFWWLYPATEIGTLAIYALMKPNFDDDIKMDQTRIFARTIRSKNEEVAVLVGEIEEFCDQWDASPRQSYFVTMAAEELCTVILLEGFRDDEDGFLQVTVIAEPDGDFALLLRDSAVTFDPFSMKTKKANSADGVNMDAMGVLVLREKAKDFKYRHYQGFNSLIIKI